MGQVLQAAEAGLVDQSVEGDLVGAGGAAQWAGRGVGELGEAGAQARSWTRVPNRAWVRPVSLTR